MHRAIWVIVTLLIGRCALIQAQEIFVPRQLKAQAVFLLPYHKLVASDFTVNDKAIKPDRNKRGGENAISLMCFAYPVYDYDCQKTGDHFTAQITTWNIESGMDRSLSFRTSWPTKAEIESLLPHEMGHMSINELHARRFANIGLADLPKGEGKTILDAIRHLQNKVVELNNEMTDAIYAEQHAYDAKTEHGLNRVEQRKATASLNERLKLAGITYGLVGAIRVR